MGKRNLTKEEFEMLYFSMTNEELAVELDVSKQTISSLVNKLGIKKKGKGYHGKLNITEGE